MEWLYKLLCCLGLAKKVYFKTTVKKEVVGKAVISKRDIIGAPMVSRELRNKFICEILREKGFPVRCKSRAIECGNPKIRLTSKIIDGDIVFLLIKLTTRQDYCYFVHPLLRFKGVK